MEPSSLLHTGKVINSRYRLVTPIGHSPRAQAYLADDIRVRKQVIVKIFEQPLSRNDSNSEDFNNGLQSLSKSSHPNLLKVVDWGLGDHPYIVTDFLAGGSLRGMLSRNAILSGAQISFIGTEVLKGISYLHERGIVHGSLKPENILFDINGDTKLAEFGLYRKSSHNTDDEEVINNLYLSPEQRNGEILSPPSDVYSFALIIKELIEKQLVLGSSINEEEAGTQNRNKETLNSLKAAIRGSFSENISDRLSASELLEKFTQISLKSENSSLLPVESGLNPDFFNQVPDQTELFDTVGKPNLKLRIKHTVLYLKARITRWVWLLLMGVLVTGMIIIINENDNEEDILSSLVPEVSGLTVEKLLEQVDGFWVLEEALTRQDGSEAGEILKTIPIEGTDLGEGEVLTYFISLGPELRTIPNGLAGLTVVEAESALLGARLQLGEVFEVSNEDITAGLVIGPSTLLDELPTGTEVDIDISSGPELRTVPNGLVGDTFELAETAIVLEGLQAQVVEVFHPNIGVGKVIGLDPESGTQIPRDAIVNILVSKGPVND